ncbi:hypothetical protein GLW08_10525 [Pontibacillus yanchengensis]|uniref:SbsA Ig-like domain-containing protein n=2 Tax=Pontibacillus yanchengensis TaxID=462910 RepID=A0A6I5A1J1_9BACI|nr:hypothetical protein [Pontibacillus yanchengensis]MYL34303.1 hypothetical protein [Pontibacillus yanchengensis]MYL53771.1 hypothetical protein [Pontibacillus yanchengensis]
MKKLLLVGATLLAVGLSQPTNAEASTTESKVVSTQTESVALSEDDLVDMLKDVTSNYKAFMKQAVSDVFKTWTIKFNTEIDPDTFNRDNVYVVDEQGEKLMTVVKYKEGTNEGVIMAPGIGYEKGVNYTLVVTEDVKTTKGVALSQGVTMNFELSGDDSQQNDKDIHEYSKEELEDWIDKEEELTRLREYPIKNEFWDNLDEANENLRTRTGWNDEEVDRVFLQPSKEFMQLYFNRDYSTIGESFKEDIKYFFRHDHTYRGKEYDAFGELPNLFDALVQDTKEEKRISESIFVTDLSMVHQMHEGWNTNNRIRGTQYIRYTSGSHLPEELDLNKWYKRDVDVQLANYAGNNTITWETAMYVFDGVYELTSYEEVEK